MTVTSGEFYNSTTGATWVLKSQNATYDITSQNFDYMPNIKKVKKGTYDKFRGYADNVFVVKGGFTTTDSKTCVTSGTQDSTYGDFRAAAIRTAGNKANVTITNKNFGSSTYHYTDANGNLIELIDTSGNRITSDNDADRIRVTYSLPTSMTLKETDSIDIKMLMKTKNKYLMSGAYVILSKAERNKIPRKSQHYLAIHGGSLKINLILIQASNECFSF